MHIDPACVFLKEICHQYKLSAVLTMRNDSKCSISLEFPGSMVPAPVFDAMHDAFKRGFVVEMEQGVVTFS